MKNLRLAALVAIMTALPAAGFAQTTAASSKAAKPAKAAKVVTMTATGVVKSFDATSVVIARSNAQGPQETFQLTSSTTRKGKLAVGDVVSLRYLEASGQKTATSLTVKTAPKNKKNPVGKIGK